MKKTVARIALTLFFLLSLASIAAWADGSVPRPPCPTEICGLN